jgi:hypothetical protein
MPLVLEILPADSERKFDETTPLELASKQYLTSKELRITQIVELR